MIGRLRQLVSFNVIATASVALFGMVNIGMAYLASFSAVALALLAAGIAWMAANSTLNTAAQTSLPAWVRARGLGVYLLVFQGAMAVGSVIWGEVATHFGLRTTLMVAGIALLAAAAGTSRLQLAAPRDADTTHSNHWPEPQLLVERLPNTARCW